ncbi:MAG: polysaccharide biosynthesis/export family protein [Pseudomonadota bacterium]|nr:polysaccharide biosynthesis/export family protein [Pseudomonadota bacterium]
MQVSLFTTAHRGAVCLLALALSGCAYFAASPQIEPAASNAGAAVAPRTELITPQLIAAEQQQRAAVVSQDLSTLVVPNPPSYTIDRGDILSIVVWDHPELGGSVVSPASGATEPNTGGTAPSGFVVDHEGRVQFPFAGALKLAGLTEDQARDLLASKLARYIASPNVTLRVQAFRSKRVYIDGEVKSPGLQVINDIPMTLMEALNRSGGLLPSADQSRLVLERGELRYRIDLRELVQKGINPGNVMLAPGDVVRVQSRDESKVFVSGEVVTPRALTMHNGRLTLNEALGEAGGVSPLSGDARQVYVVRKTASATRVFQLDARVTGAMAMAEGFELAPKDVVYVAASPLANWHRNLSLLIPGALTSAVGVTTKP